MTQNKSWKPVGWYCPECKVIRSTKTYPYSKQEKCCRCQLISQSKWIRMYVKKDLL